jgi:hypothetical protein
LIRRLWHPLGGWHSQFLWRLLGWTAVQFALIKAIQPSFAVFLAHHHWSFHVLWFAAAVICIAGLRPILLAVVAVASVCCFGEVLKYKTYTLGFPAAEWALQLPVFLLSLAIITVIGVRYRRRAEADIDTRRRAMDAEVDWGITRLLRVTVVVAMSWAAVHKLNADFFNPGVSCLTMLTAQLADWWGFPQGWIFSWLRPVHIVILEAAVPILLLAAPRVGILLALFLGLLFGSLGATRFAGLIVVMAFAFLDHADLAFIRAGLRRYRVLMGVTIVAAIVVSFLSYTGPRRWFQFGLYHGLLTFLAWCAFFALLRHRIGLVAATDSVEGVPITGSHLSLRFIVGLAVAFNLVNGFTPYLGIKYQYSFAMLSNLRVDTARWNSFVFPRWLWVVDRDPFIDALRVEATWPEGLTPEDAPGCVEALDRIETSRMVPRVFLAYLRLLWARDIRVALVLEYRGERYEYLDEAARIDLRIKLNGLPHEPLFQGIVTAEGPQRCMH